MPEKILTNHILSLFLLPTLVAFAQPMMAENYCPIQAEVAGIGVQVEYDTGTRTNYQLSEKGVVFEEDEGTFWRYESLHSVFLLRYGAVSNFELDPATIEQAVYDTPNDHFPEITAGMDWQSSVDYVRLGAVLWQYQMQVTAHAAPPTDIDGCVYETLKVTIKETTGDEVTVTYLAYLTDLGFALRVGTDMFGVAETYTPVSINLLGGY